MLRTSSISKLVSCLLAPLALASIAARADVVIEETMNTDGVAGFSLLAMQGTTTRSLTADKSRTDSNVQLKSKLLNHFAGTSGPSSQIVRLDKGVLWEVQPKDKTYTERTFADARAAMEKAMQQMEAASQQAQAQQPQQQLPINAGGISVLVSRRRVPGDRRAGDDRGLSNEPRSCRSSRPAGLEDDEVVRHGLFDRGMAHRTSAGNGRIQSVRAELCEAMGLDASRLQAMQSRMQNAFSQYKGTWTELMQKAGTFQGYPLKSAMQITMGGPQCTTDDGTQVASAPGFADAVQAGVDAGVGTRGRGGRFGRHAGRDSAKQAAVRPAQSRAPPWAGSRASSAPR